MPLAFESPDNLMLRVIPSDFKEIRRFHEIFVKKTLYSHCTYVESWIIVIGLNEASVISTNFTCLPNQKYRHLIATYRSTLNLQKKFVKSTLLGILVIFDKNFVKSLFNWEFYQSLEQKFCQITFLFELVFNLNEKFRQIDSLQFIFFS